MAARNSAGVILSASPTRLSLAPPVKNSGALHSSVWIWPSGVQNTVCQGCDSVASASALAAVPVATR